MIEYITQRIAELINERTQMLQMLAAYNAVITELQALLDRKDTENTTNE